jgi:hypothetical protein
MKRREYEDKHFIKPKEDYSLIDHDFVSMDEVEKSIARLLKDDRVWNKDI